MSLKVVAFDKDSKDRVKEAKMVEAVEKTDELEASVKEASVVKVNPRQTAGIHILIYFRKQY